MSARRQPSTTSLSKYARAHSPALANRSLDFCNAFWGIGDGGVDVLFARMRGAARTMEELRNFWKERCVSLFLASSNPHYLTMTRHLGRPSRKITLSVSPSWRRLLWVKMRLGMYSTALRCQIFPCRAFASSAGATAQPH